MFIYLFETIIDGQLLTSEKNPPLPLLLTMIRFLDRMVAVPSAMTLSRNGQYLAIAIRVCSLIPMSTQNSKIIYLQNNTLANIEYFFFRLHYNRDGKRYAECRKS
jgi:hypothetical protein